jgi:hypothetical protein
MIHNRFTFFVLALSLREFHSVFLLHFSPLFPTGGAADVDGRIGIGDILLSVDDYQTNGP